MSTARRGSRERAAITAVASVLSATGALVLGFVQMMNSGSEHLLPAVGVRTTAVASKAGLPALVEPIVAGPSTKVVRREEVGPPGAYRGSLRAAPPPAITAYQRAEVIINQATECGLDWTVLAAIGRVESNHGRGLDRLARRGKADHRITRVGLVKPALVGKPLDGRRGTSKVADTDLGRLDGNKRWDAPVGPMGLLPSTWATVAVDADGDGKRNPQDIDDAALAAAVLLCSGAQEDGLATAASRDGRSATSSTSGASVGGGFEAGAAGGPHTSTTGALADALRRYHDGKRFASTVLALAARYREQEATVPPYRVPPGGMPMPHLPAACNCDPTPQARARRHPDDQSPETRTPKPGPGKDIKPSPTPTDPTTDPTDGSTEDPTDGPTCTTDPTDTPSDEPSDEPSDQPSEPADCDPTDQPTDRPTTETTEPSAASTSTP